MRVGTTFFFLFLNISQTHVPHVVDGELGLDTISAESIGTVHDARVVNKDMQRQTLLQELLSSLAGLCHVVQIQLQEFELWGWCFGILGLDLSPGVFDSLLSALPAATG